MDKIKILVLEDELVIREFIQINLEREKSFDVVCASCGIEALELYNAQKDFDIAILDIMLPDINGFEVCAKIRGQDNHIGIIMLSAKSMEEDKITGLMKGADDYITKPFSPAELTARIIALSRRIMIHNSKDSSEKAPASIFRIDTDKRRLYKNNEEVDLTALEYAIVEYMSANEKNAVTREELLDKVWGINSFVELKVVDVTIRRIRKKIEDDPSDPKYLTTVWGYGYRWSGDA